jgi:alanine racemase
LVHPSSWIQISETALRRNLSTLKRVIGKEAAFCSVVKANAYGHGLATFVPLAERCGVDRFGVYSAEEAATVLACRTRSSDIMIMGDLANGDVAWAVENGLSFFVFDLARLEAAEKAARRCGRPARVHLELETGMHRLGLSARSLEAASRRITRRPELLTLAGVCSHFAGAESSANHKRIEQQIGIFGERMAILQRAGLTGFRRHLCCSAAALNFPEARGEMVRIGIAQYGFWPSQETRMQFMIANGNRRNVKLQRVLSWHSRVINLKTVPAGKFVGYGNSYLTSQKTRIAAIPVGYHHGIERNQSNLGHVLIRGLRCPIVGIINMNMMSVDVTHVPGVKVGDETVIIGHQGDDEITVGAFGNRINDLNYETLARLDSRIKRVVVD